MSDREVIKNYIDEHYSSLYPKYYDMRFEYIMEYSWIHFACEEVLEYLALLPDMPAAEVLYLLEDEMTQCFYMAKSKKAKCIFETAKAIISELERLI